MADVTSNGRGVVRRRKLPPKVPARTKNLTPDEYFVNGAIKYPWGARRGGKIEWEMHLAPADTPEDDDRFRFKLRYKRWAKGETHDRIPDWLAPRPEVSPVAKFVYARMRRLATGDGGGPPVAYPSIARLQIDLALNYKQVRNALAELRRHKLIVAERRTEDSTTAYRFVDHPWRRTFMATEEPEERQERSERYIRSIMNDPNIPEFPYD